MRWRVFLEPAGNDVDSYVAIHINNYQIKLKIADCDRSVKLYFTPENEGHRKTLLKKIEKIRMSLDMTEQAVRQWTIGR